MATTYDELNILKSENNNMRSLPYEVYFGEMHLTEEQKEERIALAEKLESEILFILSLVYAMSQYSVVNWDDINNRFRNAYLTVLGNDIDDYTKDYIDTISYDLTQSTKNNMGDEYNTSYDRARYISENEANTILNHSDEVEAIKEGYRRKRWMTMRDRYVRHTHTQVDGRMIPIKSFFEVGNSLMLFPKDQSMGAESKEIVNCRCSIKYLR